MSKNDGGSAFPFDPYVDHPTHGVIHRAQLGQEIGEGMSLRDYFAGQVLAGMVFDTKSNPCVNVAISAYAIADAMIAERAKP